MDFFQDKKRAAWLSVASNTLLTTGKVAAGLLSGSVSILSEAAHSGMDLLAALIATFSVHTADKPADADHQYGHEKIENISGVVEGLLIFGAAAWIIWESVNKLRSGVELKHLGPGMAVMAVSAAINFGVATLLKRAAVQGRSVALEADAAHLYTDVWTSAGVFAGLLAIFISGRFHPHPLLWLDPVIAMGVAFLIIRAAWQITRKSFLPLLDSPASAEEEAEIQKVMGEFRPQGTDFHKLRTRRAGGSLHVDLHMGFRPGVSLERGHELSHELKARIEESLPGARVLIHVEPSREIEVLKEEDETVRCMRAELLKDGRVCQIRGLRAARYNRQLRVEVDLNLDPAVTLAESHALSRDLQSRLTACFPDVNELVLSFHPGDGWQNAIHEDDKEQIAGLVGEHESSCAGIHQLEVVSSGGRHRVNLRLGLPRSLPLSVAHSVGRHLEEDIRGLFPEGVEVDLHVEPCEENCAFCRAACPERAVMGNLGKK